ncbi:MAG TPA: 6-bladed beta-propeller, partial [Gracilimonas sp.]|uniref:6-bladed beta-propeller n=1 Tax=Gracilimonas sp. TaxID=1974203 RepID=UPI002D8FEF05|nr:6-bladed beta-propeller [Gracilimonas sp.]
MHSVTKTSGSFLTSIIILIPLFFISCSEKEQQAGAPDIDDILSFTATEIFSMSEVEDVYFAHVGYESVVLENGDIAFADRNIPNITIINENGELEKVIREGRGPGEILDAYEFTKDREGNIYTYDQGNNKLLVFDENLDLKNEIIPPNYEATFLIKAYPTDQDGVSIFELDSFEHLRDAEKESESILVQYDHESESYGKEMVLKAQPYARLIVDGQIRGARLIPYSHGNLTAYNPENRTLFTFDTGTNIIAELNADFDTVRTILVSLPTEEISQTEIDSIRADQMDEQWKTMKELLPEVKAPANNMIYHKGEFWMESNILGDTEMWLVLNSEGQITRAVHLPKESMLMHVSDEH